MEFLSAPDLGLTGLFLSSFMAATLLPGGSEAVLFALVKLHPQQTGIALLLATLGNTLGGTITYAMARSLPHKILPERLVWIRHWGTPALIFAWAPFFGDAICAAAGWLRLPVLASIFWMALGKGIRYGFIALGAGI